MRAFWKLVIVQSKLFFREPAAFFFTLVFPVLLLVIFGAIFGNEIDPQYNSQYGYIDSEVPGLTGIIIATVALLGIPINTATLREQRILRRFRATPLSPLLYLMADLVVYFGMALLGMILLVIVATLLFNLRFGGNWLSVLLAFTLAALSFFAAGYLVASLAPTSRVASVIGNILFFPMMFLSGATLPLEIMPERVRQVSDLLPLTHVVRLLQGLWFGGTFREHLAEVALLLLILVGGATISVKVFRWE